MYIIIIESRILTCIIIKDYAIKYKKLIIIINELGKLTCIIIKG